MNAARQKEILDAVLPSLKKGGTLLYSTCTYAVEEDEAIVDYLIKKYDMRLLPPKAEILPFTADISEIPDLAPILSVLAAYAKGESRLDHVSRLMDKESDRLRAIREMLAAAHVFSYCVDDSLSIIGGQVDHGHFATYLDHRMAMSEAILAAFGKEMSSIDDVNCVKKSYPRFWEDFARLGGKYEVEG